MEEKKIMTNVNTIRDMFKTGVRQAIKEKTEEGHNLFDGYSISDISYAFFQVYGMKIGNRPGRPSLKASELEHKFRNNGELKALALIHMSNMVRSVTVEPVCSSNIVETMCENGYSVRAVMASNSKAMGALAEETAIPQRKGGYDAYAVVEKQGKVCGAMGVIRGEIDTKTNPIPDIHVTKQMIPIVKIAKMCTELITFKKGKGIMELSIIDNVQMITGLAGIVNINHSAFSALRDAIMKIYKLLDRSVPDETLKGPYVARELEGLLTEAYTQFYSMDLDGDAPPIAEACRALELAITNYMVNDEVSDNVFETVVKSNGSGLYSRVNLPTVKLPEFILNRSYVNGATQAQALEVKLVTTSHRGENYHGNSESTRTMAAPFPIGKDMFEAAKIKTDLGLYLRNKDSLKVLVEGTGKKGFLHNFFNALRMLDYAGDVYIEHNSENQNVLAKVYENDEVKFDKNNPVAKHGNSKFTVFLIHNVNTYPIQGDVGTVVYKYYDVASVDRKRFISSYDTSRALMRHDNYGSSYVLNVFLTASEINKNEDDVTYIASVAKHDLMGYRICDEKYAKWHSEEMLQPKVIHQKVPRIITLHNAQEYYTESILQNIIRMQYPFTALSFRDVYRAYGLDYQVLDLGGSVYVKMKKVKVGNMSLIEFRDKKIEGVRMNNEDDERLKVTRKIQNKSIVNVEHNNGENNNKTVFPPVSTNTGHVVTPVLQQSPIVKVASPLPISNVGVSVAPKVDSPVVVSTVIPIPARAPTPVSPSAVTNVTPAFGNLGSAPRISLTEDDSD